MGMRDSELLMRALEAHGFVGGVSRSEDITGVIAEHITVIPGVGQLRWHFVPTAQQEAAAVTFAENFDFTDHEEVQREASLAQRDVLFDGLSVLSPLDAGYAIVARSYAIAAGNMGAVAGITDRATAASYITSTPWWAAMNAAQRQMKQIDLEAEAIRMAGTIAFLR